MEEQQKNIDDLFRDALSGYREAPPDAVWKQIARRLDEQEGRRRGAWLRWPWVALMLAMLAGTGWWAFRRPAVNMHSVVAVAVQQKTPVPGSTLHSAPQYVAQKAAPASSTITNARPPRPTTDPQTDKTQASAADAGAPVFSAILPFSKGDDEPQLVRQRESLANLPVKAAGPFLAASRFSTKQNLNLADDKPVFRLEPLTRRTDAIEGLSPSPSRPTGRVAAALNSKAMQAMPVRSPGIPMPALSTAASEGLSTSAPATATTPLATEIPGFVPRLALDERIESPALASLDPAASLPTVPVQAVAQQTPQAAALPSSASVALTSSRGLPQPELDPLPLKKAVYAKSFSVAGLASAGYSASLNGYYDVGLRMMIQLSNRIALGIQPTFGMGNLSGIRLTEANSYYRSEITVDSFLTTDPSPSVRHAIDTIHNYVVQERLDSIVVAGMMASGHFWELNVPLVLRYALRDHWYAYGGPSLHLGGRISVREGAAPKVFTSYRKDSLAQSQALPAAAFGHYFGTPNIPAYSSYHTPEVDNNPSLRVGYIFGVGYSGQRVFAELSLRQQLSGYSDLPEPLQPVFAQPRATLSIGYLLFDSKKKSTAPMQ